MQKNPSFRRKSKDKKIIILVGMEGWTKKGGQGDYIRELSCAFADDGHVVIVINPFFRQPHSDLSEDNGRKLLRLDLPVGQGSLPFDVYYHKIEKVHYLRVKDCHEILFPVVYPEWLIDGTIYSDSLYGYLEAVVLSRIPIYIVRELGLKPDILHFNDWQSAYGPAYLEIIYRYHQDFKSLFKKTGSILTIHNMAYQGLTKWGFLISKDNPIVPLLEKIYPSDGLFIGFFDHGNVYEVDAFGITGLPRYYQFMKLGGAECWSDVPGYRGRHNVLKFGLEKVNRIVAVSRGNRHEIQSNDLGFGLGDLIAGRAGQGEVESVWNGVDVKHYRPDHFRELNEVVDKDAGIGFIPFSVDDPDLFEKRTQNKIAVRAKINGLVSRHPDTCFGLMNESRANEVTVSGVSRLVRQKGFGVLFEPLEYNQELDIHHGERLIDVLMRQRSITGKCLQFVVMGTPGDGHGNWVAEQLKWAAQQYSGQFAFIQQFDSKLANQIRSGSDVFFMPSEYEPGGISNIQAAIAGALCTVPYTGGLIDFLEAGGTHPELVTSSFNFDVPRTVKQTGSDFVRAFKKVLFLYDEDRPQWQKFVRQAMGLNVDWSSKVSEYLSVYDAAQRIFTK